MGARGRAIGLAIILMAAHAGTAAGRPGDAAVGTGPPSQTRALPKVRLIATGGTIANRPGSRLTADELLKAIPQLDGTARVESEQFANLPSSALSLGQWLALARRSNELFRTDPALSGIVITTGTDMLEELAFFLHLTVRSDRPVVVVGSMRPPGTPGYEGDANLLAGVRVAADPASRGKGVLVVLNDEINSARDATKTNTRRLDTFQAPGHGILGVVDPDRVVYYRTPLKRHTKESEFDVAAITALPRVDVVLVYQGAPGDLIRSLVEHGARGIVIAAAGTGAVSGTQGAAIGAAIEHGVAVAISSRTGGGRADSSASGSGQPGTLPVSAEDLSPVKARILLMLALTKTASRAEIQRMFNEY